MLRSRFEAPRLLHVTTTLRIYRVAGEEQADGTWCEHVEDRPDIDILIDRVSGDRVLRADIEALGPTTRRRLLREYDALVRKPAVEQLEIVLTTTPKHLPMLLDDDHGVILACGAARSSKTHTGAQWFVRKLLLRGGKGRLFWIACPEREQCWITVGKLLTGDMGETPIVPLNKNGQSPLVRSRPASQASKSTKFTLIDGTVIDLKPMHKRTGGNLKGFRVVAVLADECAEIKHEMSWVVLRGRVLQDKGQVYGATTPNPPHFLEKTIENQDDDDQVVVYNFNLYDNPWLDQDWVRKYEASVAAAHGAPAVQREIYGQWVIDGEGAFWAHWDPNTMAIPTNSGRIETVSPTRKSACFTDITASIARRMSASSSWFIPGLRATNYEVIGCMDVNKYPITAEFVKVYAEGGHVDDPKAWGLVVVDEFQMKRIYSVEQFAKELHKYKKMYRGCLMIIDPQNCHRQSDLKKGATGRGGNISARAMAEFGFDARPAAVRRRREDRRLVPYSPPADELFGLVQKMFFSGSIYVDSAACPKLLDALDKQQRSPKNPKQPVRMPGTASDRLASPTDALRYGAWAILGPRRVRTPKKATPKPTGPFKMR